MSEYTGPVAASQRPVLAANHDFSSSRTVFPCHYINIPTPRCATYNIRTFSGMPTDRDIDTRQNKLFRNLKAVMKNVDVLLLQETKRPPDAVYADFRSEWFVFRSPYFSVIGGKVTYPKRPKAGVAVLVRKSFAHNFELKHEVIVPGHLQRVRFLPLEHVDPSKPFFKLSFSIDNVYVPATDDLEKISFLSRLAGANTNCAFSLAAGDWNVRASPNETTCEVSTAKLIKSVDECMKKRGLHEVWHPAMTKISNHSPPQVSRLDKWYVSHDAISTKLVEPTIHIPNHPYEPGLDPHSPTDHFPVLLTFYPRSTKGGQFTIPDWLARKPEFADAVAAEWNEREIAANPCDELLEFNKLLVAVARRMTHDLRLTTSSRAEAITLAVAVFNGVCKGQLTLTQAKAKCSLNSQLEPISAGATTLDSLRTGLQNFLWSGDCPVKSYPKRRSAFSEQVTSQVPEARRTGADYNQQVKKAHCNDRSRLDSLVNAEGSRTSDPRAMAELLRKAWEPIWKSKGIPRPKMRAFLRSYTKRLKRGLKKVKLVDVMNECLVSRSSCPGPNGIPFVCYSVLCDIAAPIIFRVIKYLAAGGPPKAGFNTCDIFFLPKDGTGLPLANRPVAVSNTDNRILANVVRRKLEAAILGILSRNQLGFVRGRHIDENVEFYNKKFYDALYSRFSCSRPVPGVRRNGGRRRKSRRPGKPAGHDYTITFFDLAKAYDSVARSFLFTLLKHIGVPQYYINILLALYHDVVAIPVVTGKTEVRIRMEDGLK